MPDLAPEARAREQIDALLTAAGWTLQNYDRFDPTVARFIALREIPIRGGRCDDLLLADRQPISVVEAKKAGPTLSDGRRAVPFASTEPATLRRVQGQLKRHRAAVLTAACEGRLVPTEAESGRQAGRSYSGAG